LKKRSEAAEAAKPPTKNFIEDAADKAETQVRRKESLATAANGGIGPNVFPDGDQDESVTVVLGEIKLQPKQFNVITIGPFSTTTRVRPGETRNDAARRARAQLAVVQREEFDRVMKMFRECYPQMFKQEGGE
jgi:hypothetical protein